MQSGCCLHLPELSQSYVQAPLVPLLMPPSLGANAEVDCGNLLMETVSELDT